MSGYRLPGHTSNGRGTLMLERRFPAPIGRIRMASGTKEAEALADINAMLTAMVRSIPPRWDIVQAIKDKRIAPMYALSLWRMNMLYDLAPAEVLPPLEPTMTAWLRTKSYSDTYQKNIEATIRTFSKQRSDAILNDLPELLRQHRAKCAAAGHAVTFNLVKAHVRAFVRDTLRKRHPLYQDVADVPRLRVERSPIRRAKKPAELAVLLMRLPDVHRRMAWSVAVTGMGPKEYWGTWEVFDDPAYVHIQGTKRKARVRDVPGWIYGLPELPTRSHIRFRTVWAEKLGGELQVYDLRRSFAVWMEDAGIPRSRRKLYMGHAAGDVTDLYETRELRDWLTEDGERLRRYAGRVIDAALSQTECEKIQHELPLFREITSTR